ncbi:MAG: DUF2934 domain-containing protein [Gammaproteobacteria bacterium]|nr:DUF2934 domain-containing protein [Gammaproteobacteria bacterium]
MTSQSHHSKEATEKQTAARRSAVKKAAAEHESSQSIAPEERQRLIAEAAYLIAEQRGFEGEKALDDWLQAEAEVDAQYAARH